MIHRLLESVCSWLGYVLVRRPPPKYESGGLSSNIAVSAWDSDTLRQVAGDPPTEPGEEADAWWDAVDVASAAPDGPTPLRTEFEHNVTCESVHEHVADCLNPTTPAVSERASFAIGTGSPDPQVGDTSLANKAGEYTVTQYTHDARQISLRCVLSTTQANSVDISEIGIVSGSGLWNHATFDPPINKTSSIALTIDILLSVRDASEVSA